MESKDDIIDYVMLVHIFGKVESPCCANWALQKTSPKNLPDVKQAIERNFYMGNFLKSLSNADELIELSERVISTLLWNGFCLTKWVSSSYEILNSLPKTEVSPNFVGLDLHPPTAEIALGMIWKINQDKLTFKPATKDYPNTKCGILSFVASVFDALGGFDTKFTRTKTHHTRTLESGS